MPSTDDPRGPVGLDEFARNGTTSEPINKISPAPRDIQDAENGADLVTQQLKPVDGGIDAWRVLIAAFVFEALLWGRS